MIIGLAARWRTAGRRSISPDDASVGTMSTLDRPTGGRRSRSRMASVGSYSAWSTWGSPPLSEEELAARRARQRRRAAHAVAQQLDFMYQEREAYRRDAPLRASARWRGRVRATLA